MARNATSLSLNDKLAALKDAQSNPASESTRIVIGKSLKDSNWLVVVEAVSLIVQYGLRDFDDALLAVWPRFCKNGGKRDAGYRARAAALTALDRSAKMADIAQLAGVSIGTVYNCFDNKEALINALKEFAPGMNRPISTSGLNRRHFRLAAAMIGRRTAAAAMICPVPLSAADAGAATDILG